MIDPIERGRSRHWCPRRITLVAGLAVVAYPFPDRVSSAPAAPPCTLMTFAEVQAQGAVDGRTILLTDGREVRLAAIEAPPAEEARAIGIAGTHALHAQVAGKSLILKHLNPRIDRYGRLVAWGFLRTQAGEENLAELLLAQGHARVAIPPGERACMGALLAAEHTARAGKLGLWGDPRYESKRAQNPGEIAAARGRFSLVEGPVLSVRESGGVIYVNFGRRWTEDFTVTILKRNERLFTAAGLAPKGLAGRRVRIRGVVEERGGPWIEATRPEQIEILDGN
jgi:endonuclease YncB( thermonuclease family)